MEILVSAGSGALVCLSVWIALGTTAGEPALARGSKPSLLRAWCRSLGSFGLARRLRLLPGVEGAVSEIGELSWRGKRPFALYSFTERLGAFVLVVFAAGVLGLLLAWSPWGVLFAIVPPVVLCLVRSRRLRDRARRLEVAMPEAFGSLAISLASGYSLPQAMRFVGARSAEPIRTEFMRVSFAVNCGVPATEALDAMLERLDAPGLELVVLALKVSKRTGAPLGELLREAAQLCHERLELKRMLDVKTSQARMSARLVAGMPAAMVAFFRLFEHLEIGGLFVLRRPGGAVDALKHFVLRVAAPVGAGHLHQAVHLQTARRRDVRTAAEVGEVALTVERNRFAVGNGGNQFSLVLFAETEEERHGVVAGHFFAHDRQIALHDFVHAGFNRLQIFGREGAAVLEVVVKAVFNRRPDRDLRFRIEFLHGLSHEVSGGVTENFETVCIAARHDSDGGILLDYIR